LATSDDPRRLPGGRARSEEQLKPGYSLGAYDDFLLVEFAFKSLAKIAPEFTIQRFRHDFYDDDVVGFNSFSGIP
jgi:hypothetical protein